VLAAYRGDELVNVGNVGTGFKEADACKLRQTLNRLRWKQKRPPISGVNDNDVVWVHPTLIAEIEFELGPMTGSFFTPPTKGCVSGRTMPTSSSSTSGIGHCRLNCGP
jgi:bifunctional non-homologous end joining protein LigD